MNKNSKPLLLVCALILVALLAVFILGLYNIRTKNEETVKLLEEINSITELNDLARSIRMVQGDSQSGVVTFENLVLSEEKVVSLIESIEDAGRVLGLETNIVSVEKREGEKASDPDIINITIESRGSWSKVHALLRAIENLPNRVGVDELNIRKTEDGWQSRMAISLFSFN